MQQWKKLGEKIGYETPYVAIIEKTFQLPNGEKKMFDIRRINDVVHILAITKDEKVIVETQYRPGPETQCKEPPAGFIDDGEKPIDAARRELREETGYVGDIAYVGEMIADGYEQKKHHVFVATNCEKIHDTDFDPHEFISMDLVDIQTFKALLREGKTPHATAAYMGLDYLGKL